MQAEKQFAWFSANRLAISMRGRPNSPSNEEEEMATQIGTKELTEEGIVPVPGLASRWVRLPSGERAHYVTSGATGPAVILLHGSTDGNSGTSDWRFAAPFLGENGFRVYCPDLSGFGLADTRPDYLDQKPKSHVDFLIAFADCLCLDSFYLAGVGGGSMDAVKVAISNPERFLGVVFIAGAFGPVVDYATRVLQGDGSFWPPASGYTSPAFDGTEERMRSILEGLAQNREAITPAVVAMCTLAANRQRAARAGISDSPQDANAHEVVWQTKDRVDKLDLPMICLYGLGSSLLPVENGFAQEAHIPGIQFFYPDNCGHLGPVDRPEVFNQVFLEFFRDGKVGWQTAKAAGLSRRRPINPALVEEPSAGFPGAKPRIYDSLEALRAGLTEE